MPSPYQYKVGDRVIWNRQVFGNTPAKGTKGTVRAMTLGVGGDLGIEWDGFQGGHNLNGELDQACTGGWWTPRSWIRPCPPETINCPHCGKVVEPDMLGLCPNCTWILRGE